MCDFQYYNVVKYIFHTSMNLRFFPKGPQSCIFFQKDQSPVFILFFIKPLNMYYGLSVYVMMHSCHMYVFIILKMSFILFQ